MRPRIRAIALLAVAYGRAAEPAVPANVADSIAEQSGQRELLAASGGAANGSGGSRGSNGSSRAQELELEVAQLKEEIAREISLREAARRERVDATRRLSSANASLASAEEELRQAKDDAEEADSRLREACEGAPLLCWLAEPPQALLATVAGLVGVAGLFGPAGIRDLLGALGGSAVGGLLVAGCGLLLLAEEAEPRRSGLRFSEELASLLSGGAPLAGYGLWLFVLLCGVLRWLVAPAAPGAAAPACPKSPRLDDRGPPGAGVGPWSDAGSDWGEDPAPRFNDWPQEGPARAKPKRRAREQGTSLNATLSRVVGAARCQGGFCRSGQAGSDVDE